MGTRSIIVVTGNENYARHGRDNGRTTVRLYRHFDGYPTANLRTLWEATRQAQRFIGDNADRVKSYSASEFVPPLSDMPAEAFAAFVAAASIDWGGGAQVRVDEDYLDDGGQRRAVYQEKLAKKHYGNQCDLEWIYVVDLLKRTIKVYGGSYDSPGAHLKRGMTDPRKYVDCLVDEAQAAELLDISMSMDQLMEQGWELNPRRVKAH